MRVEQLFNASAMDAIERAVQSAERLTSAEIVPMIVSQSDDYSGVRAVSAALCAFAAGVVVLALPAELAVWVPPAQLGVFAAAYLAFGARPLLRHLIPPSVRERTVDRAAKLAFIDEGLVETRDRTGVLIYVSLLEHRVEVLADRGINERVEPGTWNGIVRTILDGIRTRRAEQGLIEAIQTCGELCATHFPRPDDDTDELPNRPRT